MTENDVTMTRLKKSWPFLFWGVFLGGEVIMNAKVMRKVFIFTQLQNKTTFKTVSGLAVVLLLLIGNWLQSIRIPLSLLLCNCIIVKCCPNYVTWIQTVDNPKATHPGNYGAPCEKQMFLFIQCHPEVV